jgi:hypothetical protein
MNPWDPTVPYDTSPPHISISSPGNEAYNDARVPLTFSIYESSSSMSYSLDGQDNVTIMGNATLSGLSNGLHNVTVYVTDRSGNIGASETVYFTVEVSFPVVPVATASGVSITGVAVCVFYYRKKRNH